MISLQNVKPSMKAYVYFALFFLLFGNIHAQNTIEESSTLHTSKDSLNQAIFSLNNPTIQHLPIRSVKDLQSYTPAYYELYQQTPFLYGFENQGYSTVFDGMRLKDVDHLPFQSIGHFSLHNSRSPIAYGNSLTGFYEVGSTDIADSLAIRYEEMTALTKGLDHYISEVSVHLPIWRNKTTNRRLKLLVNAQVNRTSDPNPNKGTHYYADDATLQNISENPLISSPTIAGFVPQTALTFGEKESIGLEKRNFRKNADVNTYSAFAKMEIPIAEKSTLIFGSLLKDKDEQVYNYENALFNSAKNQARSDFGIDSYAKWEQILPDFAGFEVKGQLQLQYSNHRSTQESNQHKDHFFDYDYIGKIITQREAVYSFSSFEGISVLELQGYQDAGVSFIPSNENPDLAAYNDYIVNQSGLTFQTPDQLVLNGGILNGVQSTNVAASYNLWFSPGYQVGIYQKSQQEQKGLHLNFEGKKENQNWQFGIEHQEYTHRSYRLNTKRLWTLAENFTNTHLQGLDRSNPQLIQNGQIYDLNDPNHPLIAAGDSIFYPTLPVLAQQTYFDRQLRQKLGLPLDGTNYLDIQSFHASLFSLDMFTPDDLSRNSTGYHGYNYTGEKTDVNSYEDFFTKQQSEGIFSRLIPAFRPIYSAAYFNYGYQNRLIEAQLGVRLDRYDANQPVLKDLENIPNAYQPDFVFSDYFEDYKAVLNVLPQAHFRVKTNKNFTFGGSFTSRTVNLESVNRFDPLLYLNLGENALSKTFNNSGLQPLKINNASLNVAYHASPNLQLRGEFVHTNILNPIDIEAKEFAMPFFYATYVNDTENPVHRNNLNLALDYQSQKTTGSFQAGLYYTFQLKPKQPDGFLPYIPEVIGVFQSPLESYVAHSLKGYAVYNTSSLSPLLDDWNIGVFSHYRTGTQQPRLEDAAPSSLIGVSIRAFVNPNSTWQLPSYHTFDLKIEKGISLGRINLNAYLWAENILNTTNILRVYAHTGTPDDDGYIRSPEGLLTIDYQYSTQAYLNQYYFKVQNPAFYGAPRIVRLGLVLEY